MNGNPPSAAESPDKVASKRKRDAEDVNTEKDSHSENVGRSRLFQTLKDLLQILSG